MEKLELSDLNNTLVTYYYIEIVENLDEDVENYGMEKFEKAYAGYGGVVKDGIYYDITDDGGWDVESYDSFSGYLDGDYSEDDYNTLNLEECDDVDDFALGLAMSYRDSVYDEGYGSCINDGIIYVDIWRNGEKIYSKEFSL